MDTLLPIILLVLVLASVSILFKDNLVQTGGQTIKKGTLLNYSLPKGVRRTRLHDPRWINLRTHRDSCSSQNELSSNNRTLMGNSTKNKILRTLDDCSSSPSSGRHSCDFDIDIDPSQKFDYDPMKNQMKMEGLLTVPFTPANIASIINIIKDIRTWI